MSLQTAFPARVYLQTRSVVVSTSWRLFIVNDGQALVLVSSSSSYAGRETQPNPVSLSQKAVELHIVAALARWTSMTLRTRWVAAIWPSDLRRSIPLAGSEMAVAKTLEGWNGDDNPILIGRCQRMIVKLRYWRWYWSSSTLSKGLLHWGNSIQFSERVRSWSGYLTSSILPYLRISLSEPKRSSKATASSGTKVPHRETTFALLLSSLIDCSAVCFAFTIPSLHHSGWRSASSSRP